MIMAAIIHPILEELRWLIHATKPPPLRSALDFAKAELVVPEGKTKNARFRVDTQPWTRLLLTEMDNPQWRTFAICGCVQSGKSYMGFVFPILKHICENGESVIVGVPTVDEVGRDKWNNEILPVFVASGFAGLLPNSGLGSKGGFPKEVHLRNGARLKIMGGTGGDEKRSSYTARVVVCTEVDKMDKASEGSREADPITQMAARSMRWDIKDRRLYMECTVSYTTGRIWQEYTSGTESRIACPCPHCREYVTPERESLHGWQEAIDVMQAEEESHFQCPVCHTELSDDERREMNLKAVLVHKGQTINADGKIAGKIPRTHTLGFRWNAFNNMFWSPGAIGVAEWKARRARDKESADKELSQFYWSTPWDPPDVSLSPLDADELSKRMDGLKKGMVPAKCVGISVGVDTGKRQLDWTAIAWVDDEHGYIIDYGEQKVEADRLGLVVGFEQAFNSLYTYFESGWHSVDGKIMKPAQVWIDSGYHEHTVPVYSFCLTANKDCAPGQERYRPSKGGENQRQVQYSAPKKISKEIRYIGKEYHMSWVSRAQQSIVHINSNHWKSDLHTRLGMPTEEPGAIVLYEAADVFAHSAFVDELLAEEQIAKWIDGKGEVIVWEAIRRKNHKLDSTYAATAAGHFIISEAVRQKAATGESWFGKQKRRSRTRSR